jgi:hypothetical protein
MPDTTAIAATSLPAQTPCVKIVWNAVTNGAVLLTSA